jgi:hypothetical protein
MWKLMSDGWLETSCGAKRYRVRQEKLGPRGGLHCLASDAAETAVDPRFGDSAICRERERRRPSSRGR